mmetsp:Transcript_12054/g.18101  ORF Transcript_12054/g.18101 Transcript_12054/m.18101 type:complete len:430 (-) Transcript_12054:1561-2850(-)
MSAEREKILYSQNARLSNHGLSLQVNAKGRCVVAKKEFKVGDVIFADEAFEYVLLPTMREERCEGCCRNFLRKKRMKCVCGSLFCSPQCHKKSWRRGHRQECAALKRGENDPEARLAARLQRCVTKNEQNTTEICSDTGSVLVPTILDVVGMRLWRTVADEWISLGKANNFCFSDDLLHPVAALACPFAALVNHSCEPNCISAFDDHDDDNNKVPTHYFIAVKYIRPGDEICHSYVDVSDDYDTRQQILLSHYGFHCDCIRCLAEAQNINDKPPDNVLLANRQLRHRAALAENPETEAQLLEQAAQILRDASCPRTWSDAVSTLECQAHCELARGHIHTAFTMLSDLTSLRESIFSHPHPRLTLDYIILRDCALALRSQSQEQNEKECTITTSYKEKAHAFHCRAVELLRVTKPPHSRFLKEQVEYLLV